MKRYDCWESERGSDPFREAEEGEWCKAEEALEIIAKLQAALRVDAEPPPGLLMSMAIRFDHGLGCPGYYDAPMFVRHNGMSHDQRLQMTLRQMRQLWEEVAGHGFYRPEREAYYAEQIPPIGSSQTCVRPGHPEVCKNDPKVGCCYWRECPELP